MLLMNRIKTDGELVFNNLMTNETESGLIVTRDIRDNLMITFTEDMFFETGDKIILVLGSSISNLVSVIDNESKIS